MFLRLPRKVIMQIAYQIVSPISLTGEKNGAGSEKGYVNVTPSAIFSIARKYIYLEAVFGNVSRPIVAKPFWQA